MVTGGTNTPYSVEEFLNENGLQVNSECGTAKTSIRKEQDLQPCLRLK